MSLIRAVCHEGLASSACQSSDLIPSGEADTVDRQHSFSDLIKALDGCVQHEVCENFCVLIVLWMFPCIAARVGASELCNDVDGFVSGVMKKSPTGNRSTVNMMSQHPLQLYALLLRLAK